jgi:antitoxin component of MazEF toxin-antitoxin module
MIKKITKIGNSKGIVLDKALLQLIGAENDEKLVIKHHENGLLLERVNVSEAYKVVSQKHRKSLDKLGQ